MTGSTGTAQHDQAEARFSSGRIAWAVLRAAGSVAALVAVYYLLPLDHSSTPAAVTMLLIGLAGFIAVVARQVRLIIRSPVPGLVAIESLAISVAFFLLLFAATYVVLAALSVSNFGGHLTHTDGLYFTVTVFSTAFGTLYVLLSDPGGDYLTRLRRIAEIAVIGALLTALGYGIGRDAWGWVVLALFVVTVLGGLALSYGIGAYLGGLFLNIWFLLALSAAAGYPAGVSIHPWNQALAWLIGSAIAIALASGLWLARGRGPQPSPLPGVPAGHRVKLSRPIVSFVLIRAFAVSAAAAIAFGLHVEDADWMPISAIVAMKTSLQQSTLRAVQRLAGTALGAAIASVFLVTVTSHHALEETVIVLFGLAPDTAARGAVPA